jgi:hypothetical protein
MKIILLFSKYRKKSEPFDKEFFLKKGGGKISCLSFFVAINLNNLKLFYYFTGTERNLSHLKEELK